MEDSLDNKIEPEFFKDCYEQFNNSPFDVDELYDSSPEKIQNSINIFLLNEHIQEISLKHKVIITKELFNSKLKQWLGEELLNIESKDLVFLKERLLLASALFLNSEKRKLKKQKLRLSDRLKDEIRKKNRIVKKDKDFKLTKNYKEKEKEYKRHILSVNAKGKNLKFLLEETLIIHQIKQKTDLSFEQVCLLLSKVYECFRLLSNNTNAINYAHSLKTNIYQFVRRKRETIYKFIDREKELDKKYYLQNKKEIDSFIAWIKSIVK